MIRPVLLLVALLLLTWGAVGCRSCQSHLDYCGPLPDEPCDFTHRRNSILGGDKRPEAAMMTTTEGEAAPGDEPQQDEDVPTPAPTPAPELQEGEAPSPLSPETGIGPEAGANGAEGTPMSMETDVDLTADPHADEAAMSPEMNPEMNIDPYAGGEAPSRHGARRPMTRASYLPILGRFLR